MTLLGLSEGLFGRPRARLALAVLAVQIAIPTLAFLDEPPTRFGFQMFSAMEHFKVEALDVKGEPVTVDLNNLLVRPTRPELPWSSRLPEYLCARVPNAAQVTVEDNSRSRTIKC